MKQHFAPVIRKLTANPGRIFLADAAGALLTGSLLLFVLANFEVFFGMPKQVLYYLAGIACLFAVYSFTCYFIKPVNWRPFVRFIVMANLCYCLLTLGLIIYFWSALSIWGTIYFLAEILVIVVLVYIESAAAAAK